VTNSAQIEEHPMHFLIRHSIDEDRFSLVLSSVAKLNVLLLGIPVASARRPSTPFAVCVIAVIILDAPVDPDKTALTLEAQDLLLTLAKVV
jgi:hypothetical protein